VVVVFNHFSLNHTYLVLFLGKKEKRTSIVGTFAMDLIVALEMSRLQMIKDAQQKKKYAFTVFISKIILS